MMIRIIVCRPGERATIEEIDDSLEAMQRVVGGLIEEYQPFHDEYDPRVDDVTIYCNEDGKMNRLPPCRAIIDEDGHLQDVIAGPFFICCSPIDSETIQPLPPDLEEKYRKKYELPEHIFLTSDGLRIVKSDSIHHEKERER